MATIQTLVKQLIIFCWVTTLILVCQSVSTSERNEGKSQVVYNTHLVQQEQIFEKKQGPVTLPDDIKLNRYRVRKNTKHEEQNETISGHCEIPELSCNDCCENDSNNCSHIVKICYCDSECTFYNDCCVDYNKYCRKKKRSSFENEQRISCLKPNHVYLDSIYPIWMVNKCPMNRKIDEISRNCEIDDNKELKISNLRNLVPVVGKYNLIFRNKFCAQCNRVEKFEYSGERIECYVVPPSFLSPTELDEFASKYCDISIYMKHGQTIRQCYQTDLCPPAESERCSQKFAYECATKEYLCRGHRISNKKFKECISSKSVSLKREYNKDIILDEAEMAPPPFNIVFDVSEGRSVSHVQGTKCYFKGEFYDLYLQICRPAQIISPVIKENLDRYDVAVWFQPNKHSFLNETISSLVHLFNIDRSQVTALQMIVSSTLYGIIRFELELTNEQTLRLGKANYTNDAMSQFENDQAYSTNNLPLHRLLLFSGKFNVTVEGIFNGMKMKETFTVFKTTSRQLACIQKQTYPKGTYTSIQNGKYYYINSTGKTFPRKQVFFEDDTNKSISVCEQIVFSSCVGRRINLTSGEYVKFDNLSIFYNRTKTIKDFGEYEIEGGQISMCIPETYPQLSPSDSLVIQTYLTWVCVALSLVFLFLVIQTYVVFPELRTMPGKNLLSLSMSLFLVQLLWLIPERWYPPTLCYIVAVIKHYLFLVSFVSMAIIAWYTHSVFASKEVQRRRPEKKKIYKYSAIVWGLPAMFVLVCAVVDQKDIYAVYVNELWCLFDNVQAQKYLFVLPVGVILLFNIIFFGLTVFRIQRVHSGTRLVHPDQSHRTMLWIYLKISALMGFAWLFGFIHLLVGKSTLVFSYLFVIFASLQGVYIGLAFVVKKHIWQMYKKLLRKNPERFKLEVSSKLLESLKTCKETTL